MCRLSCLADTGWNSPQQHIEWGCLITRSMSGWCELTSAWWWQQTKRCSHFELFCQKFVPCCCWDVSELIKRPADVDPLRPKGLVTSNKGAVTGREGKIAARPRCTHGFKTLHEASLVRSGLTRRYYTGRPLIWPRAFNNTFVWKSPHWSRITLHVHLRISCRKRLRSGLAPDVYILQTHGRMKGERRNQRDMRITSSCSAATQSPPKKTEGLWARRQRNGTNIRGLEKICAHCGCMSEGQIKEAYITCLKSAVFALLLFQVQSDRTFTRGFLKTTRARRIEDVVRFWLGM